MSLLNVENLKTYYFTKRGPVKAVDDVSFQVEEGQAMGLAGESGCGKTTVALSIIKVLPSRGKIVGGKVSLKNLDITTIPEKQMKNVRWKRISLVFQGAMNALDPLYSLGDQIVEAILTHESKINKKEAMNRAEKLLQLVGIERNRLKSYPHELSGGMRQRGLIAMALACNPELLIADEPGTALDVIVQAQVLNIMEDLRRKLNLAVILITHDLSIIADTCDKVAIMYAGKVVEHASVSDLFEEPLHPYTQGLIQAFPNIKSRRTRMRSIPGSPPDLLDPPMGCRFHPRCPYAKSLCMEKEPSAQMAKREHSVACHLYHDT
ncbi:MAG: ABC transporter ATP-binding protein [Candidatus Bathyarchaeota archaeon]|nr:ABC transporter ATP-binding protein [Candidatus Bathyarchaeota archaeon]MDH5787728.1 ABC transporter ATP-binding protein [Candidatus Bathyarchaeota archaeon]